MVLPCSMTNVVIAIVTCHCLVLPNPDYKCSCKSGFEGETCSDVDECTMNKTMCDQNADCFNTPGGFSCACKIGFFGTGQKCQRGQCQDSICANNKKCSSLTTMDCVCEDGYVDGVDDKCLDVNECLLSPGCDVNAKCINLPGSYACECDDEFYGNGTICLEGDCIEANCPENEQCVSPRKSDCECKAGYERDDSGKCIDSDECKTANDCHQEALCSNTEGNYTCDCKPGYFGTGFSCLKGNCNDASCSGNQTCISPTSTSCGCSKGLKNVGKYCYDINECSLSIHDCPIRSNCINKVGSYDCECYAGYNDMNCTDLNVMVCQMNDQCVCKDGYDEHVNGTCTDVNECSLGTHQCQKDLDCVNESGSYKCDPFCEEGFKRAYNGTCIDVDECTTNLHNCPLEKVCTNTNGGFSCKE